MVFVGDRLLSIAIMIDIRKIIYITAVFDHRKIRYTTVIKNRKIICITAVFDHRAVIYNPSTINNVIILCYSSDNHFKFDR
jgi:hypothetical protein